MTYNYDSFSPIDREFVVTQTMNVTAQLYAGVRAFDMRVRLDADAFLMFHSGA